MNESFSAFVRVLTAVLWGPHVLLLILLAGVWFTLRGRFMQVTKLPGMTRGALCGTQRCGGFSAFQSLTASLAGSLGTGNILGVAAAILVGGAGAVVWMWIAAFFGMMTVYAEGVLAAKFGTKNAPGAIGYVQKAFGRHGAKIYAAGCVLSALGMGTMAQTGAASSVLVPMGVPRVLAGIVFAGLLLLCVRGGLPKAVHVTEKLVPFMAGLFLALCAAVLLLRGSHIPGAVRNMLKGAFSLKSGCTSFAVPAVLSCVGSSLPISRLNSLYLSSKSGIVLSSVNFSVLRWASGSVSRAAAFRGHSRRSDIFS